MPNLTLLSILAVTISVYFGAMWVTKMINDRGDDILNGVFKGVPASTKDRHLMLFTNWLPYAAFLVAFLVVAGVGVLELARGADDERVAVIGYMCAVVLTGGALFWAILGSFVFTNMVSALRKAEAD
jgi:lysylphosphatidylglycerol synthetase-like protein (DUF2156 family)